MRAQKCKNISYSKKKQQGLWQNVLSAESSWHVSDGITHHSMCTQVWEPETYPSFTFTLCPQLSCVSSSRSIPIVHSTRSQVPQSAIKAQFVMIV